MPHSARAEPHPTSTAETIPRRHLSAKFFLACILCPLALVMAERLASQLLNHSPGAAETPWPVLVLIGLMVGLTALGAGVHILWAYHRPLRQLRHTLEEISRGEAPLDELRIVPGPMASLHPALMALLHDWRQQKAETAKLRHEMRQRIAHRTDALERIIGSLRQQATRDALTGLFNRRMLDQHLPQLLERCRAENAELCLLMMDVDHFKLLNDALGHAAGDSLLQALGQLIRSGIREHDLAFRYGGDEFVVLLPDSGRQEAKSLGERLIRLVDDLARTLHVERPPRLSIGFSTLGHGQSTSAAELLRQADEALYGVKAARKTVISPLQPSRPTLQCPTQVNRS